MTKEEFYKADSTKVLLVDIREDSELEDSPSPVEAIHIAMSQIAEVVAEGRLPKDRLIVTLCYSGGRCVMVNKFLEINGYKTDYLEGGMVSFNK